MLSHASIDISLIGVPIENKPILRKRKREKNTLLTESPENRYFVQKSVNVLAWCISVTWLTKYEIRGVGRFTGLRCLCGHDNQHPDITSSKKQEVS